MINVAIFGSPGCGKGTQSKLLIEKYHFNYISTGDVLRHEIALETELGQRAKEVISRGHLVDDETMAQILENRMVEMDHSSGFLFDGFPRTFLQCYILDGMLAKMGMSLACILNIVVPDDVVRERIAVRSKIQHRLDDNPNAVEERLEQYKEKSLKVLGYYESSNKILDIDGLGSVEEIADRIDRELNTFTQRNGMILTS